MTAPPGLASVPPQEHSTPSAGRTAGSALVQLIKAGLGLTRAPDVDGLVRDEQLASEIRPLGDFLYDHYWRVRVEGAHYLPAGPCLVVANHAGVLPVDGPVLRAALKRERPDLLDARWLVEDAVYHAAFLGPLLHRLGALRASPDNALRVLRDGRPLIVFPEGNLGSGKPFSERYQLQRLGRGGFVKVALEAGVPILPAAILGSEETSPLLARVAAPALGLPWIPITGPIPLPARWQIRIAPPILPQDLGSSDEPLAARVERGTERTRAALQEMLDALFTQRGNAFA